MTHRPPVTPALAALLPFALLGPAVFAYNPPTDQAGRLSVRIEGPAEVTETGVALPLGVVLRNGGQSQLRGTVRLRVIDQWKADPDGAVRFQLGPGETAVLPFSITGGDLHRQCVAWSGGERVWVNRGQTDWPVGETLLPEYAFLAEAPCGSGTLRAGIVRRQGVIVEFAHSAEQSYVNGRQWADPSPLRSNPDPRPIDFGGVITAGGCRIRPHAGQLEIAPLPGEHVPAFWLKIDWPRLPWQMPLPQHVDVLAEDGSVQSGDPRRDAGTGVFGRRVRIPPPMNGGQVVRRLAGSRRRRLGFGQTPPGKPARCSRPADCPKRTPPLGW